MQLAVHLDRARLFRWHLTLVEALHGRGHAVAVQFRDTCEPLPTSLTAILDFDAVRNHAGPSRMSERVRPEAFTAFAPPASTAAGPAALEATLDLSSSVRVKRLPGRVLRPHYDGSAKDYVFFHALLEGRAPMLTVADTASGGVWTIGMPAVEQPTRLAISIDQVSSRLVEGLVQIVQRIAHGEAAPAGSPDLPEPDEAASMLSSAGRFAVHRARAKLSRLRDRAARNTGRWVTAWRRCAATGLPASGGGFDLNHFHLIEDDGQRFFADPFLFEHEGRTHLFVEEFPYDTGRGVISHIELSESGTASRPQRVLETGFHLSYPLIFRHGGDIWMLPEQSASGGLDLYRCARFPDQWTYQTRLIDGRLHDATLFEHAGLFWIAATTEAFQSSTWDALSLFFAPDILGPWQPHARNPVHIDARYSRPAGPLFTHDGALYRPAQDCSKGYGGQLAINRIQELTPAAFSERREYEAGLRSATQLAGPHTYSRAGGFEAIDVFARPGDLRAFYRGPAGL